MKVLYNIFFVYVFLLSQEAVSGTLKLLMFESSTCYYCEIWHKEIGAIYPKTSEGRLAPLERLDIFDSSLHGNILSRDISFTPTFVLINDNMEVARLEGYPGEDFFWGLLSEMLLKIEE